jgi:hypothetical protein
MVKGRVSVAAAATGCPEASAAFGVAGTCYGERQVGRVHKRVTLVTGRLVIGGCTIAYTSPLHREISFGSPLSSSRHCSPVFVALAIFTTHHDDVLHPLIDSPELPLLEPSCSDTSSCSLRYGYWILYQS